LVQGLLNKKPEHRLDWPQLLDHPFVKESEAERLEREQRICKSAIRAEASLAWKGEGGAIAGAPLYSGGLSTAVVLRSSV
jgi:fused-like protein